MKQKTKMEIVAEYHIHKSLKKLRQEIKKYKKQNSNSQIYITFDGITDATGKTIDKLNDNDIIIHIINAVKPLDKSRGCVIHRSS